MLEAWKQITWFIHCSRAGKQPGIERKEVDVFAPQGRGRVMRTIEHVLPIKRHQIDRVLRYLLDTLLACVGSLLVTAVIVVFHLYPAIPNISIVYLLVVLALAITRGRYAAILSAVAAFLFLSFFLLPPLYTFSPILTLERIALFILFLTAIHIS